MLWLCWAGSAPCSAAAGCSGAAAGGGALLEQAAARANSQVRAMIVVAFIVDRSSAPDGRAGPAHRYSASSAAGEDVKSTRQARRRYAKKAESPQCHAHGRAAQFPFSR